MDPGISAVRNLVYVLLVMSVLAVLSSFYTASQLSRNNDELAAMRVLLKTEMMGDLMTRSNELQKRMDALQNDADGIDAKLQKAQDSMVVRLKEEMPKIMDNYLKSRTPGIERQAQKELQKHPLPTQ